MSDDIVTSGIIESGTLEGYLDTLGALVDECRIHIGDHGLRVSAVEPANVAMWLDTTLAPRAFEHFETPGEVVVGVPLTTLSERLGPTSSGDLVEFEVDMGTRHLNLSYGPHEMSVALIDQQSIRDEPDRPGLDLPNTVVVTGTQLERAVEVADLVSDHLAIQGRPDERAVRIVGEGDNDNNVTTWGDEETLDGTEVTAECELLYSTSFWEDITAVIPNDAEVSVTFGEEFPVVIEYDAVDGALDATAMIAPRIQRN